MLSLVSFAGMTLNKCAVLRIGMLTGGPLCRESHPLCRLKKPTVVYMITCRLSSCKTGVYNVHLLIILERGCSIMYRKKEKRKKNFIQYLPVSNHQPQGHVFGRPFPRCQHLRCLWFSARCLGNQGSSCLGTDQWQSDLEVGARWPENISGTDIKNVSGDNWGIIFVSFSIKTYVVPGIH